MELLVKQSTRPVHYEALAKRWSSDLDDFSAETKFLHHLFEDYFLAYYSHFYHEELRNLEHKLDGLEKEKKEIEQQMKAKLLEFKTLVGAKKEEKTKKLEELQLSLESLVSGFIDRFRSLKKELFVFVEDSENTHERFESCR